MIVKQLDLAVIDVSFISLTKVIPKAISLLSSSSQIIALIKPQFEAGKELVSKGGVVRESSSHLFVIQKLQDTVEKLGWQMVALTHSPLRGPAGNVEFLAHFTVKQAERLAQIPIAEIVKQAHQKLLC